MAETVIEAYLRDEVKKLGGKAYKWVSPGNRGVPDRIVFLPGGGVVFIELKDTGKKPTDKQAAVHVKLRTLGVTVLVIDSKQGVNEFIQEVRRL